ncbi:MAG TPA: ATP-dependent Clp protease proteolytic subunit [Bryobacteraceae bacterium]|nr:ATP-dependent Clp protease proteolytic subunit [Bryobacteraceae bacterium]
MPKLIGQRRAPDEVEQRGDVGVDLDYIMDPKEAMEYGMIDAIIEHRRGMPKDLVAAEKSLV